MFKSLQQNVNNELYKLIEGKEKISINDATEVYAKGYLRSMGVVSLDCALDSIGYSFAEDSIMDFMRYLKIDESKLNEEQLKSSFRMIVFDLKENCKWKQLLFCISGKDLNKYRDNLKDKDMVSKVKAIA